MYEPTDSHRHLFGLALAIAAGLVIGGIAFSVLSVVFGFAIAFIAALFRIALVVAVVAGIIALVRMVRPGRWSEHV
jgi:hypothetical protein